MWKICAWSIRRAHSSDSPRSVWLPPPCSERSTGCSSADGGLQERPMTESLTGALNENSAAAKFIAIDGPAGSGKSSVSKAVARTLGYGYLDTGAAYRALAWFVLDRGADTDDTDAVPAAASAFDVRLRLDPDDRTILAGESDITEAIREPRVSDAVSGVARVPAVREQVNIFFRSLVAASPYDAVIVEGRDITTV